MKEIRLDAAVIGAGTAGLFAASRIARKTENFAVFEGGTEGTTCARVGCMPSKAVIALARAFCAGCAKDALPGFPASSGPADTAAVMGRVRKIRDGLYKSTAANARARFGEKIVAEKVSFAEPMVLEDRDARYLCGSIVVASGSTPAVPPGWSLVDGRVVTTDAFFELPALGRRVLAVGMGPVGIELSMAMARLGLDVTMVEMTERVAAISDPDVDRVFKEILSKTPNFSFHLKTAVKLDGVGEEGVRVTLTGRSAGAGRKDVFDLVLLASGRRPNVDGLRLENSGLLLDDRGFAVVDPKTLRAEGQRVFFAGDVSGIRPFYHDAADQGVLAGENAVAPPGEPGFLPEKVPLAIVFTSPNVAMVGKAFHELPKDSFVTGGADAAQSGRGKVEGGTEGRISLYFGKSGGKLLGAQMAAPDGEHLAHYLSAMIHGRFTVDDVLALPFYHPTYEELVKAAAEEARRALK